MSNAYIFEKDCTLSDFKTQFSIWYYCYFLNWPLYVDGKEKPRKEANYSRMVGGSFNKQRNLHRKLVLGILKISWSLYPPASHILSPDDLNTLLSEGFILKNSC